MAEHQEEVKMNKSVLFGALAVAGVAAGAAAAGTLDDVKARGKLTLRFLRMRFFNSLLPPGVLFSDDSVLSEMV